MPWCTKNSLFYTELSKHYKTLIIPISKIETIPKNSIIIDNPPFSDAAGIVKLLQYIKLDFILVGNTLTALNVCKAKFGYIILGTVGYTNKKTKVNSCLFSNMFTTISHIQCAKVKKDIKYRLYNNLSSANIETVCKNGAVLDISKCYYTTKPKRFGGSIFYKN